MGSDLNPISLIPAALSIITGNADQKASDKNNQNQQTAELANAQQAAQAAQSMYNNYSTAHPAPFAGASVAKPQAGAYSSSPSQMGVIQQILQAAGQQKPQQPQFNVPKPPAMPMQPQAGVVNAILGG